MNKKLFLGGALLIVLALMYLNQNNAGSISCTASYNSNQCSV